MTCDATPLSCLRRTLLRPFSPPDSRHAALTMAHRAQRQCLVAALKSVLVVSVVILLQETSAFFV